MLHDPHVDVHHAAAFDVDAIDLADLRKRQSAKYQVYDADVIPAWIAEMDFPLAPPVTAALHAAIDRGDTGYRSGRGLAEALGDFARDTWGWDVPPATVTAVPDVLTGLAAALSMVTEPGDAVVVNPPVYPPFYSTVTEVSHRRIVDVPMVRDAEGRFDWDLGGLADAFARPDVRAYVMCSPHNPTGTVPSASTLRAVAALAQEHGVAVIADEIHAPLTLPGATHVPYLTAAGDDAEAVGLMSASKAWNLPGLKCAQMITTQRMRAPAARLPMEVTMGTGHLGVIAAVAAYREGRPWLTEVIAILDANRRLLADLLAGQLPAAGYVPPEASYLAWLDLSAYGLGDDPTVPILERGRVALSPGPTYGAGGAGFARLNFGTSPAIVREIVRRIAAVVQ